MSELRLEPQLWPIAATLIAAFDGQGSPSPSGRDPTRQLLPPVAMLEDFCGREAAFARFPVKAIIQVVPADDPRSMRRTGGASFLKSRLITTSFSRRP